MLVPVAGYFIVYMAVSAVVFWLPGGNKARRYLVFYPVLMLAFLAMMKEMWGQLPLILIPIVAGVTIANLSMVRFCAKCGDFQPRRVIFSKRTDCRTCGGEEYVTLWKALSGPGQGGAA